MQPNEFAVDTETVVEAGAPAVETVLEAIRADAVVETEQYLTEVVTPLGGE
jgi:hypothetical protein